MPRKFFKKILPQPHTMKEHRYLAMFGDLLHNPNLWHIHRYSVATACSIGLFMAFVPVPFQMVLAAAVAILVHANLPISVILVWVSNPLTMPLLYYSAYRLGVFILGATPQKVAFALSFEWLQTELLAIWKPFLLGCFLCGVAIAILSNIAFRLFWRCWVIRHWRERQRHRELRKANQD